MSDYAELLVKIGADVGEFAKAVTGSMELLDAFADKVAGAAEALTYIGAIYAFEKIAEGVIEASEKAGEFAENLERISSITGTATGYIQDLSLSMSYVGLSSDNLVPAFRTLSKSIIEAQDPSSNAARAFRELGVNMEDLAQGPEHALEVIGQRVGALNFSFERNADVVTVAGRAAQGLIPLWDQGADATKKAGDRMAEMNAKLSEADVKKLDDMNKKFKDMEAASTAMGNKIAVAFEPLTTAYLNAKIAALSTMNAVIETLGDGFQKLMIRIGATGAMIGVFIQSLAKGELFTAGWTDRLIAHIKEVEADADAMRVAVDSARALGAAHEEAAKKIGGKDINKEDTQKQIADKMKALDMQYKAVDDYYKNVEALDKANEAYSLATVQAAVANKEMVQSEADRRELDLKRDLADQEIAVVQAQLAAYMDYVTKKTALMAHSNASERAAFGAEAAQQYGAFYAQLGQLVIKRQTDTIASAGKIAAAETAEHTKTLDQLLKMDQEFAASDLAVKTSANAVEQAQIQADLAHRVTNEIQAAAASAVVRDSDLAAKRAALEQEREAYIAFYAQKISLLANASEAEQAAFGAEATAKFTAFYTQAQQLDNEFATAVIKNRQDMQAAEQTVLKRNLDGEASLAAARLQLRQAQQLTEVQFFKSNDDLRRLRMEQLAADQAKELADLSLTDTQKLAIETKYAADRLNVAKEFPTFWEGQLQNMQQSAQFAYGQITSNFANELVKMKNGQADWATFFRSTMDMIMSTTIQVLVQMGIEWALASLRKKTQDTSDLAAHTVTETTKTTVTTTNVALRTAAEVAASKAIAAELLAELTAITALGDGMVEMMGSVMIAASAMMQGIAAALTAGIVTAELAGPVATASVALSAAGASSTSAGIAAIEATSASAGSIITAALAVPAMAAGGVVSTPTLVLAGEAGPEAIVPLSSMGGQSSGDVTVNVFGAPAGTQASSRVRQDALKNMVIDIILRDVRGNGPLRAAIGNA